MILFFDTETTGLPRDYHASISDVDNRPRVVQLAWQVDNQAHTLLEEPRSFIIYPEGFTIPDEAAKIHGITTERALAEGYNLLDVLELFQSDLSPVDDLVAHNAFFDRPVLGAEYVRAGMADPLHGKRLVCTMRGSAKLCRLPGARLGQLKWPKLAELHQFLFGCGFEGAHDAKNDVLAGVRCYWELKKRGVL